MAGLYPDVPGPRMAWHRDGSKLLNVPQSTGIVRERSVAEMLAVNGEDESGWGVVNESGGNADTHKFVMLFPELRDVVGYYLAHLTGQTWTVSALQSSIDTTNGNDGTWTNIGTGAVTSRANILVDPDYRTNIITLSGVTGIRAIRFTAVIDSTGASRHLKAWHLYGTPSTGQTRYLIFTDTGGTEVTGAYFDFGDDPRGGPTETKQFKVKNAHATLQANTITVSFSTASDKSPSFVDDYLFSTDGATFTSSVVLGSLAPGASSGTLYIRRTTPTAAAVGLEAGIISAVASTWS